MDGEEGRNKERDEEEDEGKGGRLRKEVHRNRALLLNNEGEMQVERSQ